MDSGSQRQSIQQILPNNEQSMEKKTFGTKLKMIFRFQDSIPWPEVTCLISTIVTVLLLVLLIDNFTVKDCIKSFVIGSCLFSSMFSYSYVIIGFRLSDRPADKVTIESMYFWISYLFGISNIIMIALKQAFSIDFVLYPFIIGYCVGMGFTIYGRFRMDLPIILFGFNAKNQYIVHIVTPFAYALVFQLIVHSLNQYI